MPIFQVYSKTLLRATEENKQSHSRYMCRLALEASGYNGNLHTCAMHALFGCVNKLVSLPSNKNRLIENQWAESS